MIIKSFVRSIALPAILTVAVLLPPSALALELSLPALQVVSGQSFDIPVTIDKVENLAGVKLVLVYNNRLITFKKGARTPHTTAMMHMINDTKPGRLVIVMATARGIKGHNMTIMTLTFEAKKGLKQSTTEEMKIPEIQLMSDTLKNLDCRVQINPLVILPE